MKYRKVDFHSHYLSPTYYDYLKKYEGEMPDNFPTPKWNVEEHLKQMDSLSIDFAFISISSPNLSKAPKDEEVTLARQINEEGAQIVRENKTRLGLFAGLPLPHVEESIQEARFALEDLGAFGFSLSTNYAGIYLGDEKYDALMEYLDSASAVVAIHPVEPYFKAVGVNDELPIPAMEFLMDTTRTFMNMEMHNIFERYPNIKWIIPHCASFISILSDRISGFSMQFKNRLKNPVPLNMKADMKRVYFDCAGFAENKQLEILLKDVSDRNLLYGSDTPYTPKIACMIQATALENSINLNDEQKGRMFLKNAVDVVPQLSEILGVESDGKAVNYKTNRPKFSERVKQTIRSIIAKLYSKVFE